MNRHLIPILLGLLLSAWACDSKGGPDKATPTPKTAADKAATDEAPADKAATDAKAPPSEPTTHAEPSKEDQAAFAEHMKEHFNQALQVREAIIDGNLEAAVEPAKWLANHEKQKILPTSWTPHLEEMRAAANTIATAKEVEAAGAAMGKLGDSCGACHKAVGATATFPKVPMPSGAEDTKAHMERHAWAMGRLWEGLVKPSDDLWTSGAIVLAEAPLDEHKFLAGVAISDKAKTYAKTVHTLATEALSAKPEQRGELFGKFLGTCSGCHAELRPAK